MDNTKRFSDRVEAYVKYRPGYPQEAVDMLFREAGLSADSTVADIGAGTGIFTQYLLAKGCRVTAVEPNAEMRAACEARLGAYPGLRSAAAAAEATGLETQSVDAVFSAQAFHWFDPAGARKEFRRILRPGGIAALIWNSRQNDSTAFLRGYEALLQRYGIDYAQVNHKNIGEDRLKSFFAPGAIRKAEFANRQLFDFEGLRGRLLSSSYAPLPGYSGYEPLMDAMRILFDREQQDGQVSFDYVTEVYWGAV